MTGIRTSPRETPGASKPSFKLWPPEFSWDPDLVIARLRRTARTFSPKALWRDHRLFTIVALVSILPRFVAAMGFKPALFIQDSFSYMQEGTHFNLGQLRPAGYPMLLRILEPFHSLLLVTTLQHGMGIAIGVIIYGVLRSTGLPAWGAVIAALPTLFDSRQIWLESSILPDTLFTLVLLIAVALLVTRRNPGIGTVVLVGLLTAWASVIRGNGAPVFVVIVIFLLIRKVGWKVITACVAAFAVPLLGYGLWFYKDFGQFNITNSSGLFLWSRTMSFANCSIINPPANLRPLCPENQPGYSAAAQQAPPWSPDWVLAEKSPASYLWAPGVWYQTDAHPGVNSYNNKLATEFALRAIAAQPGAYIKTVAQGVFLTFFATDRSESYLSDHFTVAPHVASPLPHWMSHDENAYAHTAENTHVHQPWAYIMFWYQMPVWFPGWLFLAVFLTGLGFLIARWRGWGVYAGLAWTVGVVNLVIPIAAHELDYRYALSAVPFACLALGLALSPKPVTETALPEVTE